MRLRRENGAVVCYSTAPDDTGPWNDADKVSKYVYVEDESDAKMLILTMKRWMMVVMRTR
jgi:hypothetical protein